MTTRLTMICHAATTATKAASFPLDEPLEAETIRDMAPFQARRRAGDLILTSPALRARQTATALTLEASIDEALEDCNQGSWAGSTISEIERKQPAEFALWLTDPDAAPHGGEPLSQFCKRISHWLDRQSAATGRVVAITHAGVIRAAILKVLDAPLLSFWRIDVAPLSETDLSHDGRRWVLRSTGKLQRGQSR